MCSAGAKVRTRIALPLTLVFLFLAGCAPGRPRLFSSRWAMDDERYAQQYSAPYSDNKLEKWSRMGQQMVDARFQKGTTGVYANAGMATKHIVALGGEIGVFTLPASWLTFRVGAVGLLAEGLPNYLVGGVTGIRAHAPTRLSPYVGLAGMAGYSETTTTADHSYVDGDGNLVMEGQTIPGPSTGLMAIIPEAGFSYWVNSRFRMSLGASYYLTTEGHDRDFLMLGLSLEGAPGGSDESHEHVASPGLNEVLESEPYIRSEEDRMRREEAIQILKDRDAPDAIPAP